jgi:hypothetical protein
LFSLYFDYFTKLSLLKQPSTIPIFNQTADYFPITELLKSLRDLIDLTSTTDVSMLFPIFSSLLFQLAEASRQNGYQFQEILSKNQTLELISMILQSFQHSKGKKSSKNSDNMTLFTLVEEYIGKYQDLNIQSREWVYRGVLSVAFAFTNKKEELIKFGCQLYAISLTSVGVIDALSCFLEALRKKICSFSTDAIEYEIYGEILISLLLDEKAVLMLVETDLRKKLDKNGQDLLFLIGICFKNSSNGLRRQFFERIILSISNYSSDLDSECISRDDVGLQGRADDLLDLITHVIEEAEALLVSSTLPQRISEFCMTLLDMASSDDPQIEPFLTLDGFVAIEFLLKIYHRLSKDIDHFIPLFLAKILATSNTTNTIDILFSLHRFCESLNLSAVRNVSEDGLVARVDEMGSLEPMIAILDGILARVREVVKVESPTAHRYSSLAVSSNNALLHSVVNSFTIFYQEPNPREALLSLEVYEASLLERYLWILKEVSNRSQSSEHQKSLVATAKHLLSKRFLKTESRMLSQDSSGKTTYSNLTLPFHFLRLRLLRWPTHSQ